MCGITFVKSDKRVNELAITTLLRQLNRGTDSFGFYGQYKKENHFFKTINQGDFFNKLEENNLSLCLLHHRLATSNAIIPESSHPFLVKRDGKEFYFVHNGILYNDDAIKVKYIGYDWTSKDKDGKINDSEVLAVDFVNNYLVNKKLESKGSIALACLVVKDNKAEGLYYYKSKNSDLTLYKGKDFFILSSEGFDDVKDDIVFYYDFEKNDIINLGFLKTSYSRSWEYNENWGGRRGKTGGLVRYEHGHEYDDSYDDSFYDDEDVMEEIRTALRGSALTTTEKAEYIQEIMIQNNIDTNDLRDYGITLPKKILDVIYGETDWDKLEEEMAMMDNKLPL